MKRTISVMLLTAALLAALVIPAAAEGGKVRYRWLGARFSLVGEITALDVDTSTLTVQVNRGNQVVKSLIGTELAIATNSKTRFLQCDPAGCLTIAFSDLDIGDVVSISGNTVLEGDSTSYLASRVSIDCPSCSLQ